MQRWLTNSCTLLAGTGHFGNLQCTAVAVRVTGPQCVRIDIQHLVRCCVQYIKFCTPMHACVPEASMCIVVCVELYCYVM